MLSYDDLRREEARPAEQASENARRRVDELRRELVAQSQNRDSLRSALQHLEAQKGALVAPQAATQKEIVDLRGKIHDLQREIDSREKLLGEYARQQANIDKESRERKLGIRTAEDEASRLAREIEAAETALAAAQERVLRSRVRALNLYLETVFKFLQESATAHGARESYDKVRAEYEQARHSTSDREVAQLHEERLELQELLKTAQVQSLRSMLEQRLRDVETRIAARFPGLLEGPPPATDVSIELFHWYDDREDLTRLVLPLPFSCWNSPPQNQQDPCGVAMCKVIWSITSPFSESVPTIDTCGEVVVLEFHGDFTGRLSDDFIEFGDGATGGIRFLAIPLEADVATRLGE